MFTDVPEEIRAFSHYSVRPLLNGGWFVSIRKVRRRVRSVIVKTKEELTELRNDLQQQGFVGAVVEHSALPIEEIDDEPIFDPIPNPLNTRKGRSNPYKDTHGGWGSRTKKLREL